ncbi:MAG: response regulator [Chloroflexi bacterium]|nr:response regulator [Chloroflexota bacterium]
MSGPETWRILIVEDETDTAQVVSTILEHHVVEVHHAADGTECLEKLSALQPTLVIMDLAMPQLNGWDTLIEIRANPDTAHIPVVALTAYHSMQVARDAAAAGFDGFFMKPVSAGSFVTDLGDLLARLGQ